MYPREELTLPVENVKMAEFLESTSHEDNDRSVDSTNFLREKFDIFKHDYREAFDAHGHEKLANLSLSPGLKEEVVATMRKLRKAKFGIESCNFAGADKTNVKDLLAKITSLEQELEAVSHGNTEFSSKNINLPDVDADAIKSLFGDQSPEVIDAPENKKVIEQLCDFNKEFEEKINGFIGAAILLLNEYKEFENYVRSL